MRLKSVVDIFKIKQELWTDVWTLKILCRLIDCVLRELKEKT
jgi:hypothetical protein